MTFDQYMDGLAHLGLIPCAREWPDFARFCPWHSLTDIRDIRVKGHALASFCGVYLLALFDGDAPSGCADPFAEDQLPRVAYVGRTRTKPLSARFAQLEKALRGAGGHSGGNTLYQALVGAADAPQSMDLGARIRVAALPVWVSRVQREPGDDPASRRQTCFRTAAIEAALIEAINDRKRHVGSVLANEPSLTTEPPDYTFI